MAKKKVNGKFLVLLIAMSTVANATEQEFTVEMPLNEVVEIVYIKHLECEATTRGTNIIKREMDDGGIVIYRSFPTSRYKYPIKFYEVSEQTTLVIYEHKRLGSKVLGWLNGAEKCNGK